MPINPPPLPPRQAAALRFIERCVERDGSIPTVRELMTGLGLSSPNSAAELIEKLIQRGLLEKLEGVSRGIRLASPKARSTQLPLIGRIAAGAPVTAGENIEEMIDVNPALFHPRADYLFRVSGSSMINIGVFDGDLVAIHEDPDPAAGGIVAAATPEPRTDDLRLTLKRYRRNGQQIVLLSENDDQERYAPQVYGRGEVQILGRYAGLIRPRT